MKRLTIILVAAIAALFSAALYADDYPSRPITFVAVFGPGSASDTICRMLHVPYKTTGPALQDIIAGRVSMMFADFTSAMPQVEAGTVRPLAISRIHRSSLYPYLPTMDEAGIKGFDLDAWAGLVAPAGTPPTVVTKLNGALRKIIDSPDVQTKFKNVGFEGFSSTPEELGAFMKVELGKWQKMVKESGINPD